MNLRYGFTACCLLVAEAAFSQGALGTKKDVALPATKAVPSGGALGGMQLIQLVVALGIVIAILKFILPKIVGKFNKRLTTSLGSSINIEESASFAGGSLFIVSARGKSLLISVTPQAVTCLSDLTASQPEEKAFFEIVDEAKPYSPPAPTSSAVASIDNGDVLAALDRLARLER